MNESEIIRQTRNWVEKVVIGLNFCPFAQRELINERVRFTVSDAIGIEATLENLLREIHFLEDNIGTETTLLIYPLAFSEFDDYLDLLDLANALVEDQGYEGIFQVASFHPIYQFADSAKDDAANYTNRSPYPMLHLLREESLELALENYPDPDTIPERNVKFAREKGLGYMQVLLESCMKNDQN
jgi:uncharacterized protein